MRIKKYFFENILEYKDILNIFATRKLNIIIDKYMNKMFEHEKPCIIRDLSIFNSITIFTKKIINDTDQKV